MLPYIAYNLCCLAIYLKPIPLTPPDDEAGIGIPLSSMRLHIFFYNGPTCLCFHSTMSIYDYVYLVIEAMSSMTLLSQYLHIHFQFIFYLYPPIFKLYLFLKTNEIYLFSNIEGRFFTFCFCPCVPS